MTRLSLAHLSCSWAQAAEAIGDKWSIMIIRDAFFGVTTFSAFVRSTGISRNILIRRLDHLIEHGILAKRPVGVETSRHEYVLTDKGRALFPIVVALYQWSDNWVFGEGKEPIVLIDREDRQPLPKFQPLSQNGKALTMEDVTITAGKGADQINKMIVAEVSDNDQ